MTAEFPDDDELTCQRLVVDGTVLLARTAGPLAPEDEAALREFIELLKGYGTDPETQARYEAGIRRIRARNVRIFPPGEPL